jgi:molybdopterin-containing oxidoreductase family iron-sulfur binding subunit
MNDRAGEKPELNLASIRARLQGARGQAYWRSLDEVAETKEFQSFLENEFPRLSTAISGDIPRREALRLIGASLALAGLTGCGSQPAAKIVPYVRAPEDIVPGNPLFYATVITLGGYATGVLVESHTGRPTKVEGNPEHPASLGATDPFAQASVLTLYDPDRSQVVLHNGLISSWVSFVAAINTLREEQSTRKGAGLRILTETVTSPTLASQIRALLTEFPEARWHQYEPAGANSARMGARMAFGRDVHTVYRIREAEVVLSLDADFLSTGPGKLRYARDWAERRDPASKPSGMNRLYVAEAFPTNTGAVADHRIPVRASEIGGFGAAVAGALGIDAGRAPEMTTHAPMIAAIAQDLASHRGASLVIPGEGQPPSVHALAHAINFELGNVGKTLYYTDPVEASPVDQDRSLVDLVEAIKGGRVDALIILGGNPLFTAPADLDLSLHITKVKQRFHLGLYQDETARYCHWHVDEAHFLESWSDARAFDGTLSIQQPLIAPLYDGKSAHEILSVLLGKPGLSSHDVVYEFWKSRHPGSNFEEFWQKAVHDGFVSGSRFPATDVALRSGWANEAVGGRAGLANASNSPAKRPPADPSLEIVFRPDPAIWDGRFANNGWLQELPKPLTKLTWDNAAFMGPATAQRLGVHPREIVELHYRGSVVRAPVWIMPGNPADSITVHFGYGRSAAGRVGSRTGFNAYTLRTSDAPHFAAGLEIRRTGADMVVACTQDHQSMEGRNIARAGTIGEYERNPGFVKEMGEEPARDLSMYPGFEYKGYAWGMSVNLNACIGCNACTIACQAENNIPVVGKTQVDIGREMHWIRVDRYFKGDLDNPSAALQPVMCQHCENAPCEPVCPVAATSHSSEGLNQMVYNRCVGTRYCSNNCPYKVRRFNFLQFADFDTPSLKPLRNPDVSVRGRGVMEKCTFCIQRINAAKIQAEKEDRTVRDGEIVTACQAACPTGAIVFGDINDSGSRVARLRQQPLSYGLLAELNTRPRTTYLARLRNPNPAIEKD